MEISGNNNTVYYSTTVNTSISNEHSFNQANSGSGCAIVVLVLGLALILGIVGVVGLGVFEFWNFLLAWVM